MTKPAPTPATEAGDALIDADDYAEQVQALRSERARLLALPSEPSQVIERPTGRTVGNVWKELDDEARRCYLLAAGVKVHVRSNAALRAQAGREIRYVTGDPHTVIGTLSGIVETFAYLEPDAVDLSVVVGLRSYCASTPRYNGAVVTVSGAGYASLSA